MVRVVDGQPRLAHTAPIFKKLYLLRLKDIGHRQIILILHRKLKGNLPTAIDELFDLAKPSRNNRFIKHVNELFSYRVYKEHTISWAGSRPWNIIMAPLFPSMSTVQSSKHIIKKSLKR